jgi:antitoxin CptB
VSGPRSEVESEIGRLRRERIRWHCRRGMLELDLALQRFADRHLATLSEADLDDLERVLMLTDNDLLDLVLERSEPAPDIARIARMIQNKL